MCGLKTGDIVGQAVYICIMLREVRRWNRLPQEAVDVFEIRLDGALSHLVLAQSQEVRNR